MTDITNDCTDDMEQTREEERQQMSITFEVSKRIDQRYTRYFKEEFNIVDKMNINLEKDFMRNERKRKNIKKKYSFTWSRQWCNIFWCC